MLCWRKLILCRRWTCRRVRLRRPRSWRPTVFFCIVGLVSLVLSVISFMYTFRHHIFENFVKCSDQEALGYIDEYCQLYKEGKITGSLCGPLCETHQVNFSRCTNFHAGKKVNIMTCSDYCIHQDTVSAVLKSSNDNITIELRDHPEYLPEESKSQNFSIYTGEMIKKMLMWEFGFLPFSSDIDVVQLMWEKNYVEYTKSLKEKRAAYRTIMMLMDQTEYKAVKALEMSEIVPRIYGTCGPLYLQESCPPGLLDIPILSVTETTPTPPSWEDKAEALIKLLNLIPKLEHSFAEVLHMCDVKGDNFGICSDGSVKIIDADNMFFDTRLKQTFNTSTCKRHEDCNFFDCGGWCKTETGKCRTVLTNNNFQTVCRDLLTTDLPSFLHLPTLLSGAPSSMVDKLNAAAQQCLEQTSVEQEMPVYKPSMSLLNKLMDLLVQSLIENSDL